MGEERDSERCMMRDRGKQIIKAFRNSQEICCFLFLTFLLVDGQEEKKQTVYQ